MSAKVSGTTISLTRGDSLIIQISVNQEGKPYEVKPGDNLLDENSQPVLDEAGNVVTATFKTPSEIASNSAAVWSRWYKLYKYMDGSLSEEDYAPVKAQRQAWRDRINELEA